MRILSSLLVASLLLRGVAERRSPLLTRLGPIRTAHLLPGRARFVVPRLRGASPLCGELAARLGRLEGVREARASDVSGSVLIVYDEKVLEPALLVAAIAKLLRLESEIERPQRALLGAELREVGAALDRALLEQSGGLLDLRSGIPIALGVVGLVRLARADLVRWPAATTMLWWAYSGLSRGGGARS